MTASILKGNAPPPAWMWQALQKGHIARLGRSEALSLSFVG
jgi:hypothetical protein